MPIRSIDANLHVAVATIPGQLIISPSAGQICFRPAVRVLWVILRHSGIIGLEVCIQGSVLLGLVRIVVRKRADMCGHFAKGIYEERRVGVLAFQSRQVVCLEGPTEGIRILSIPWREPYDMVKISICAFWGTSPEGPGKCDIDLPGSVSLQCTITFNSISLSYLFEVAD